MIDIKNCTTMEAASIQGHADDKLFKQRLAEKIQTDVFSHFGRVTASKLGRKGERKGNL